MRAMILAAGLGTRLRPLTDELPKPLVPVGDRPAVAHIAERLAAAGIRQAVLNTHHLAAAFTPLVLGTLPLDLSVVHESTILGTGGGVANAATLLGPGDVVVWNGDILVALDVAAMAAAHRAGGAYATLAVAPRAVGEGTVGVDDTGRVTRLRGERFGRETAGGDFLGVSLLSEAFRARLLVPGCLIGDGCLPALREEMTLATFPVSEPWDDIGSLDAYLQANARWLARRGLDAYRGSGARVAPELQMTGSVVGTGAVVEGAGRVRGSVVWPGAYAKAPLDGVVVTRAGVVTPARRTSTDCA